MERRSKAKVLFYREAEKDREGNLVKPEGVKGIYVCLIRNGRGVVARGVSACSGKDQLVKKVGRNIAYNRALGAIENKGCLESLDKNGFTCKGCYKPELTQFEKNLVARAK